jgi:hypothetical protein
MAGGHQLWAAAGTLFEQALLVDGTTTSVLRPLHPPLPRTPRSRLVGTPPARGSWTLFGLGAVIAVQHLLAHAGWQPLPVSLGWQDLLVGYPTAGLLAIVGAFMLEGSSPRP